jgi:glycosyltransferase involved in cell wall biosynthesis
MSKNILMIYTPYMSQDIAGNNRTNYIPQLLAESGYQVEKICSNFDHHKKKHVEQAERGLPYKLTIIPCPGYEKNVSVKRFISQKVYAHRLKKYLTTINPPDVVFSNVPYLDVADVARKYAKENHIKFIIDIRDLWPEAFKMVVKIPLLRHIIFLPQTMKANRVYRAADKIIAVSDTYKNRALKVNKKARAALTVYLGTDLSTFDEFSKEIVKINRHHSEILLAYVGTLGNSYDLETVFTSMKILNKGGYENLRLFVIGSGPLEEQYKSYADKLGINVEFTGRLPYKKMVSLLVQCDIALNPIIKGSAASIINKHADYAAAGLPVVNSQENQEYRHMVEKFYIGLNCNNSDPEDMALKIEVLLQNEKFRREMGANNRALAEKVFDRKITYQKILDLFK